MALFLSCSKASTYSDLPTCPYLYGNQLAIQMYMHISQNMDKKFPESTGITT